MKIRAAVLEEFGQPLVVQELDLAEPKDGEVLVRLAACGVCHTDLYTASGADPTGYAPCVLGHEGAGVVERVGSDVTLVAPGDHVITLFSPECGECIHCRSGRTNRCVAIRDQQGLGYLPDGTTRLSSRRRADAPLHGHVDVRRVHGDAGDRAREGLAGGVARGLRAVRLRSRDGDRRGALHGGRSTEARRASSSAAGSSASAPSSAAGSRARSGSSRSTSPKVGSRVRVTTVRPTRVSRATTRSTGSARRPDGFGADYTFEATGNVAVMRQAVEAAREAWGLATMVGVAGKGETLDIVPRFLITGRRVTGSSFGGVKGRTQVPQLVDRWLAGEIDVESLLSHRLTLDEVNRGFELMEAQDGIRSVITFA